MGEQVKVTQRPAVIWTDGNTISGEIKEKQSVKFRIQTETGQIRNYKLVKKGENLILQRRLFGDVYWGFGTKIQQKETDGAQQVWRSILSHKSVSGEALVRFFNLHPVVGSEIKNSIQNPNLTDFSAKIDDARIEAIPIQLQDVQSQADETEVDQSSTIRVANSYRQQLATGDISPSEVADNICGMHDERIVGILRTLPEEQAVNILSLLPSTTSETSSYRLSNSVWKYLLQHEPALARRFLAKAMYFEPQHAAEIVRYEMHPNLTAVVNLALVDRINLSQQRRFSEAHGAKFYADFLLELPSKKQAQLLLALSVQQAATALKGIVLVNTEFDTNELITNMKAANAEFTDSVSKYLSNDGYARLLNSSANR
ncbi:MAG: hypothetical protein ACPGUD_09560 [Parashewanella sp.]